MVAIEWLNGDSNKLLKIIARQPEKFTLIVCFITWITFRGIDLQHQFEDTINSNSHGIGTVI